MVADPVDRFPGRSRSRLATLASLIAVTLLVLAAFPAQGQLGTDLNLINTPPLVLSVTPQGLLSPLFEVTPEAGDIKELNIAIVVEDLNGCNDLSKVDVTIKAPDGSTVATEELTTRDSCAVLTTATYTYTHPIQFYHAPGDYNIEIVATDSKSATGNNLASLTSFRVQELVSLGMASASLSFGAGLEAGGTTPIQALAVQNTGNVVIDTQISGTALGHDTTADEIPVGNITWSLASDMTSASTLTGSAVTASNFDLAAGASSEREIHWQATIPKGLPAGTYTGSLTLGAVKSV